MWDGFVPDKKKDEATSTTTNPVNIETVRNASNNEVLLYLDKLNKGTTVRLILSQGEISLKM